MLQTILNIKFTFQYSPWWIMLFCIIAILLAALLYYKNKLSAFSNSIRILLFSLRMLTVLLLLLLLIAPLITIIHKKVVPPEIIIAFDNSESIIINNDSAYYRNQLLNDLRQVEKKLKQRFNTNLYFFSDDILPIENPDFKGKYTNLGNVLDQIYNRYYNRNVGAIILATDGIYNQGNNPLYSLQLPGVPIFPIALGDTTIKKDVIIEKVICNPATLLGNTFPVEILIKANECKGENLNISITRQSKSVFSKTINVASNSYFSNLLVELKAENTGTQHYQIQIQQLADEITTANNTKHFYIDVLDQRLKILLLYQHPHPDISAIKQALNSSQNFTMDVFNIVQFNKNLNEYNAIVLFQLPSETNNAANIISNAEKLGTPILFCLGQNAAIAQFNQLNKGIAATTINTKIINEVLPAINKNFSMFSLPQDFSTLINELPPLAMPFATYTTKPGAEVLFFQKINKLVSSQPLMVFGQDESMKYAVVAGEGLWRWRLTNYKIKNNHSLFDELIIKTFSYLANKSEKKQFKVNYNKNYDENLTVMMNAELYNDNSELVNTPDATITIENENQQKFQYQFSKTENAYQLDLGYLPQGVYYFKAQTKLGQKILEDKGNFTVSKVNQEVINIKADHYLLRQIAHQSGGKLFLPKQWDALTKAIEENENVKSVEITSEKMSEFINLRWLIIIILAFLATEWFIRKYNGNY